MAGFVIAKEEWEIAHKLLDAVPDGTKLPYSMCEENGQLVPRKCYQNNPRPYQTTHSFIKVNGVIYAIAQGKGEEAVISDGTIDKVKYAQDENDELILLKIGELSTWNQDERKAKVNEASIMVDVSQSYGYTERVDTSKNRTKQYIAVKFLGTNLKQYLRKNDQTLDDNARLDIGIRLAFKLHRLHQGLSSSKGLAYAHLDLKSDNVTVDKNDDIHIIDYGLAEESPKEIGRIKTGADACMPYINYQQLTKEQIDTVSLKRILFMPISHYGSKGWVDHSQKPEFMKSRSVFTEGMLTKYDLHPYINTFALDGDEPDYHNDHVSALAISAMLISAKLGLNFSSDRIKNDVTLAHALTGLYFDEKENDIKQIIANEEKIKLIGALQAINKYDELKYFENDKDFCTAFEEAKTHRACVAMVYLKRMKLGKHYGVVLKSDEAMTALLNLIESFDKSMNVGRCIDEMLGDTSGDYIKSINFLVENKLYDCYSKVFGMYKFASSIASIDSNIIKKAMVILIRSGHYSENDIIMLCHNEQLAKIIIAATERQGNELSVASFQSSNFYHELIKNPDVIEAYENCIRIGVKSQIEIGMIISSAEKSKAFNILCQAKESIDEINLSNLLYSSDYPSLIIKFDELGLGEFYSMLDNGRHYELAEIFKSEKSLPEKITGDMIKNEYMRKGLSEFKYSHEKMNALFVLFNLNLVNDKSFLALKDSYYLDKIICTLHQNKLDRYIENYINGSFEEWHVKNILEKASNFEEMSFIMENIEFFEKGKANREENITSINELRAYKVIKDSGLHLKGRELYPDEILAINQLEKNNKVNKTYLELIRSNRDFVRALTVSKEEYFINAVLAVANWENKELVTHLIGKEHNLLLLAKMLNTATNEEHGEGLIKLFEEFRKLKSKKSDLETRKELHAAKACGELVDKLETHLNEFFDSDKQPDTRDDKTFERLAEDFQTAISGSRKELESHRGVVGVIDTILTVLASLVIFYPAVYAYQKYNDIQYSFFRTDSAKIIDNLGEGVKKITPPRSLK